MTRAALAAALLLALSAPGRADPLLANPRFEAWEEGRPAGWQQSIGAHWGDPEAGPLSRIEAAPGGVTLRGDAETRRWQLLSQRVALRGGPVFVLRATAGSAWEGAPGPFSSCTLGLWLFDASGAVVGQSLRDVAGMPAGPVNVWIRAPEAAVAIEARLFLARPGSLTVTALSLEGCGALSDVELLRQELLETYPQVRHRRLDLAALAAAHPIDAELRDPARLAEALSPYLAAFKDPHIWLQAPGAELEVPYPDARASAFDARAVAASLRGVEQIGRSAFCGTHAASGYGYLAIGRLGGDEAEVAALLAAVDRLKERSGLILDLRPCVGGDERVAQAIAGRLADAERVYARALRRSGREPGQLREDPPRRLLPIGPPHSRPIAVLTGPVCMSSGEALALMMRALPHAQLIGAPTRGASGNPRRFVLPCGLAVFIPQWLALDADGEPFEGEGIAPDIRVDEAQALTQAIAWLDEER